MNLLNSNDASTSYFRRLPHSKHTPFRIAGYFGRGMHVSETSRRPHPAYPCQDAKIFRGIRCYRIARWQTINVSRLHFIIFIRQPSYLPAISLRIVFPWWGHGMETLYALLGPVLPTLLRHIAKILANGSAAFFESYDAIGWNSCDMSQKR